MDDIMQLLKKLPLGLRNEIMELPLEIRDHIEEIRLYINQPLIITSKGTRYKMSGPLTNKICSSTVDNVFHSILDHSAYAYQEELKKGYVTLEGGHRIGICGRTVVEAGEIKSIKDISSLNIRRSREWIGVSDKILPHIFDAGGRFMHTLIVSPPMCGKTTLLRDVIRNLAGLGYRVGVCDERSEIAGCHHGQPSFDLGLGTDVLDGCPKDEGMIMLIRAMSPDVIATDEIGKAEDLYGIEAALCAGIKLITTIHGKDYGELLRSGIGALVEKGIFQRILYLSNIPAIGTVIRISDGLNQTVSV